MIIQEIKRELENYANQDEKGKRIKWEKMYYEKPKFYGVPLPIVRKISSKFFSKVKQKTKREIIQLCENLLSSGYTEERVIAFDWAFRLRREYKESDFNLFESWLKRYTQSWGACDDLCTHAFGAFIHQFPEFIPKLRDWTKSSNRWMRRASGVVLIYSIRRKKNLENVLEMADALLIDEDIMVQKGYGWMLKEASNHFPEEVFNYVMKHKKKMPRTALRYAIEKLSLELRKEAMKRD